MDDEPGHLLAGIGVQTNREQGPPDAEPEKQAARPGAVDTKQWSRLGLSDYVIFTARKPA